jgi:hypothetical protein
MNGTWLLGKRSGGPPGATWSAGLTRWVPVAGERKGITYEAIVMVALEELIRKGKVTGRVFWNEKPDT